MKCIALSLCIVFCISSECKTVHTKRVSLEQKELASIWTTETTFYQELGICNPTPAYYTWPRSTLLLFSAKMAL